MLVGIVPASFPHRSLILTVKRQLAESSNVSIFLVIHNLPFIEKLRVPPIREDTKKVFTDNVRIDIRTGECIISESVSMSDELHARFRI